MVPWLLKLLTESFFLSPVIPLQKASMPVRPAACSIHTTEGTERDLNFVRVLQELKLEASIHCTLFFLSE